MMVHVTRNTAPTPTSTAAMMNTMESASSVEVVDKQLGSSNELTCGGHAVSPYTTDPFTLTTAPLWSQVCIRATKLADVLLPETSMYEIWARNIADCSSSPQTKVCFLMFVVWKLQEHNSLIAAAMLEVISCSFVLLSVA